MYVYVCNNDFQPSFCCKSNCITFYRSPGMRSQVGTQKEQSQLTSTHKNYMHYLPKGGGGGLRTFTFKIICSKSNSITFCRSPGMRSQVGRQKERSQLTFCLEGGLRTMTFKIFCSNSKSITFYRSPGMRSQVRTEKERSQLSSFNRNSAWQ